MNSPYEIGKLGTTSFSSWCEESCWSPEGTRECSKSVTDLSGNSCDKSYPCREMLFYWENEMKQRGFKQLMTSTMSNEGAQYFYRKLGCRYAGGLLLNDEPLEILLAKTIM